MSEVTAEQKKAAQSGNTSKSELRALAEHHVDLARLVARNPSTSEALLRQLSSHEDATVRKWVTSHPATPTDVLLSLGQQFPEQLLENPILDFLFLENPNLLNDFPLSTIRALMKRRATPESILRFGAKTSDEATQLAVVQNPSTTEDLLTRINKKAASPKVKDAIKARRQAEPDATAADALFWEEVCARVAEYGPKKAERKMFEAVCANAPAAAQSIDWLSRRERANAVSIPEEDLEAFAEERNPLIIDDLLARTDLPVRLILRLIPRTSTESLLRLAKNKIQAPAVLRALAENKEEEIRIAVAKHPATPASILERMSADESEEVRAAVAKHPQTPVSILEAFAYDRPDEMLEALAENNNTPTQALRVLIRRGSSLSLSHKAVSTVHVHLHRQGLELPYLMKVARSSIAANRSCPPSVLEQLASDEDEFVRRMVAANPNTPAPVVERLALEDVASYSYVSIIAKENLKLTAEVLDRLASKSHLLDAKHLARNPSMPVSVLELLAGDESVRADVGGNPNTCASVLSRLATDDNKWVRRAVAGNPNSPKSALELLARDGNESVREAAAENPNTPIALLELLSTDDEEKVRTGAARNTSTPVARLDQLAGEPVLEVRVAVGSNPSTPQSVLELLAKDDRYQVRSGVAGNPNVSLSVLEMLARENTWDVRRGVCCNPNTPHSLLVQLLRGNDRLLRHHAATHPSAYVFFDDIMSDKNLLEGVLQGFLSNPNIIPKLEPYIPDFLRLLAGKEPLLGCFEG